MAWIFPLVWGTVVLSAGAGVGLCYSFLDFLCDRDVSASPAIMHFHNTTLTPANLRILNGMVVEPQDGNQVIFRNGDFVANGEFMKTDSKKGIIHGNLSISMPDNGEKQHGRWIVVENEAEAETVKIFDDLLLHLNGGHELAPSDFLRMMETLTDTVFEEA